MATHNEVILNGWVKDLPTFNEKGGAKASIGCIRGVRNSNNVLTSVRFDYPVIITKNPEAIEVMKNWKVGDIVEIKGFFASKDVKKGSVCKCCGHLNVKKGTLNYIEPIIIRIIKNNVPENEVVDELMSISDLSNHVLCLGTVCKDLHTHTTAKGLTITLYGLAMNRKYFVEGDGNKKKTDYVYIKSFGKQATLDSKFINKNSVIFVEGAVQVEDEIVKKTTCENCNEIYEWKDYTMEVVPYSVEYLRNTNLPEEVVFERERERHNGRKPIE